MAHTQTCLHTFTDSGQWPSKVREVSRLFDEYKVVDLVVVCTLFAWRRHLERSGWFDYTIEQTDFFPSILTEVCDSDGGGGWGGLKAGQAGVEFGQQKAHIIACFWKFPSKINFSILVHLRASQQCQCSQCIQPKILSTSTESAACIDLNWKKKKKSNMNKSIGVQFRPRPCVPLYNRSYIFLFFPI